MSDIFTVDRAFSAIDIVFCTLDFCIISYFFFLKRPSLAKKRFASRLRHAHRSKRKMR